MKKGLNEYVVVYAEYDNNIMSVPIGMFPHEDYFNVAADGLKELVDSMDGFKMIVLKDLSRSQALLRMEMQKSYVDKLDEDEDADLSTSHY